MMSTQPRCLDDPWRRCCSTRSAAPGSHTPSAYTRTNCSGVAGAAAGGRGDASLDTRAGRRRRRAGGGRGCAAGTSQLKQPARTATQLLLSMLFFLLENFMGCIRKAPTVGLILDFQIYFFVFQCSQASTRQAFKNRNGNITVGRPQARGDRSHRGACQRTHPAAMP